MLKKIDNILSKIEGYIIGTLILSTTVILFFNVIFRAFSMASTWAEEIIRYVIVWVTFFGGSLCAKHGNHVGIDVFVQLIPSKKIKRFVQALGFFSAAIFSVLAGYAGAKMTNLVIQTSQKSPAVLMPFWIVYVSIPLGFALMTIRFIVAGISSLTGKNQSGTITLNDDGEADMTYL